MKKTFILASFASILLACNTATTDNAGNDSTAHHSAHDGPHSSTGNQQQVNSVKETMDKMMMDMHSISPTGNNNVDFAAMMVSHHKGAVEMSKVEMDKGNNSELRAFAQKVIDDQNKEIAFMESFISKAPKTTSSNAADFQKALNGSMAAMMSDSTPLYNDIDKDFAAQMIPHHQSAVDMAKAYLAYGQESSLRTLCQNIVNSQTQEINWLKEWLAKNTK
jgi:uncharacterized protein (DUF305 family)